MKKKVRSDRASFNAGGVATDDLKLERDKIVDQVKHLQNNWPIHFINNVSMTTQRI